MSELFTVGHSNHAFDAFAALLAASGIERVCDVRSVPHSRRFPWFGRRALAERLASLGVDYAFLGAELGARRTEPELVVDGRTDYERIAQSAEFLRGLAALRASASERRTAILCAERDPLDCHRAILVARHLAGELAVRHLLGDGTSETHGELEARLLRRCGSGAELFADRGARLAEAYERRGREIAFRPA